MAIIDYIEAATTGSMPDGILAPGIRPLHTRGSALERARLVEITTLAEELTVTWGPVRTFGSGASSMERPQCACEMFRWVSRVLAAVDRYIGVDISAEAEAEVEGEAATATRPPDALAHEDTHVSVADIVLYQFLDFVHQCYRVDVTAGRSRGQAQGQGQEQDDWVKVVYGRPVHEVYPNLATFYAAFSKRRSGRREGGEVGEVPSEDVLAKMRFWYEEVW